MNRYKLQFFVAKLKLVFTNYYLENKVTPLQQNIRVHSNL